MNRQSGSRENEASSLLLDAQNLSYSYDYPLFENVSLQLREAQSIAVIGISGSGKSTLLHILSTLLTPRSGSVRMFDRDVYGIDNKERLAIRRKEIGIVFQFHYLFKGMSARENIEVATLLGRRDMDEGLLRTLDIEEVIDHRAADLSGGQQQRVSIARVLAKKPRLLFADEPTGNLDDATADLVMNTMFSHFKEVRGALFMVTHDESLAHRCDQVYRLHKHRLVRLQ